MVTINHFQENWLEPFLKCLSIYIYIYIVCNIKDSNGTPIGELFLRITLMEKGDEPFGNTFHKYTKNKGLSHYGKVVILNK